MNHQFRRVYAGTAITHLVVIGAFVVVQFFLMGARPLKMREEITMIDLSGPAGGGGEPGPVAPVPPKPPDVKIPDDIPPPPDPPKDVIHEPIKPKQPTKVKAKPKQPTPQVKAPTPPRTNLVAKAKSKTKGPKLTADQIRALLSGAAHTVGSSKSRGVSGRAGYGAAIGGGGGGGGGADSPVAWYYAMVKQIMYEAWQQPSGLANAGNPIATVTIRVKRDGTISDWQMSRPSGNKIMDDSVKRAVQAVRRLKPLPPQFIGPSQDISIEFELQKLLM